MHTSKPNRTTTTLVGRARVASHTLLGCLVTITAGAGLPGDAPTSTDPIRSAVCCTTDTPAARSSHDSTVAAGSAGSTGAVTHGPADGDQSEGRSVPDRVGDIMGGVAARLRTSDGEPLAGEIFLLLSASTATPEARVYEQTPYTHDGGAHPETVASNRIAARTVATITGSDVEILELTNPAGGGASAGIIYAIAYLDVISDGAFTGDLRVAATGRLEPNGFIGSIDHIDDKTVAAGLADADVLFTPTVPTADVLAAQGARLVGEIAREPNAGATLDDPLRLEQFRQWGADRPDGMDIVDARHLIDVAAYLCGTGSGFACHVEVLLDRQAQQRFDQLQAQADAEADRLHPTTR
jgi:hypothetical protein